MNASQRLLLLFGGWLAVFLAPYFNPLIDSISPTIDAVAHRLARPSAAGVPEDRLRVICTRPRFNKPFAIDVYVRSKEQSRTVRLILPTDLVLEPGQPSLQQVLPTGEEGYAKLTWKVVARKTGEFEVRAESPGVEAAYEGIRVSEPICCGL